MLFFTKDNSVEKSPRAGLFIFIGAFFLIIATSIGGFYLWKGYFSPAARYGRQMEANMEKYYDWEANYTKAMTEDTYGGKTPEETLQMFIAALKKEDIDLASKYFMLNTGGKVDQEWIDGLAKTKEAGKLQDVIDLMAQVKLTFQDNDGALFKLYDSNGEVQVMIQMKVNKFSKVWKIESL